MKYKCVNDGRPARRRSKLGPGHWCDACDRQYRLYGDPLARKRRRGSEDIELAYAVESTTDECIVFEGRAVRGTVHYAGSTVNAARAVWIIANGDPGKLHVLHSCGGGSGENGCINIRHLYLGDDWRNRWDMVNAGRQCTPLTEADVKTIRSAYRKGSRFPHPSSARALALRFGIHDATVRKIASGEHTWLHV